MYNVAVLMSTYNGEKYLSEQIDSILSQKDVNIDLYIRDDGSNDNTVNHIKDYMRIYNNVFLYNENNIGISNSFMELLYKVPTTYDYYAFSDQDDIWFENKIIKAIEFLNYNKKNIYTSNQTLVDKNNNIIGNRYNDQDKINIKPIEILFTNMLAGCTMVFSNIFYKLIVEKNNRPSKDILDKRIYDVWFSLVGSLHNELVYDKNSYIYYRQHDNNVVGAYKDSSIKKLFIKFKKLFNKNIRNFRSSMAKELLIRFPDKIKNFHLLYASANISQPLYKIYLIKNIRYLKTINNETCFGLFFKIVFNYY